ncbi:hypothetical protein Tco_0935568 [Tanacetum coccineum]
MRRLTECSNRTVIVGVLRDYKSFPMSLDRVLTDSSFTSSSSSSSSSLDSGVSLMDNALARALSRLFVVFYTLWIRLFLYGLRSSVETGSLPESNKPMYLVIALVCLSSQRWVQGIMKYSTLDLMFHSFARDSNILKLPHYCGCVPTHMDLSSGSERVDACQDPYIYSMAGSDDEIPPPPPLQTPTQQAPHTVSTIKLPILKNGNGPVSVSTYTNGVIKVLPLKTAKEILARERERKARTTLLMALPEDHLVKFHKMTDAKYMWDAIKSRFGGNDESKKMHKYILKQQFKGFSVSNSEGLHKGYDRFKSLLSQLEIHGVAVSTEDVNQKFLRSYLLPGPKYP